jgi:hypothetical protein
MKEQLSLTITNCKTPRNKFRLLDRKKKLISSSPSLGVGEWGREYTITREQRQHCPGDQRAVSMCHAIGTNMERVPECQSPSITRQGRRVWRRGKAPSNVMRVKSSTARMVPKKASDRQDLNYQILFKTPKRDIYYSENKFTQCINLSSMYY